MNTEHKSLQLIENTLPIGSVDAYIYRVNQIPMLSEEEEKNLATKLYEQGDIEAARQMVLAHLRFVVKIARGYNGYGLSQADLIQEGNIGLMKAVKRFNPGVGVRLVSFAVHWIRAEMHEFIVRNWRIVKIATTKAQRKLFFNLRQLKNRLGWFSAEEAADVAKELGVSVRDVRDMEGRLNSPDVAFEGPSVDESEEHHRFVPAAYLEDKHADPLLQLEADNAEAHHHEQLYLAFDKLDARSQEILRARWLAENKATLHDLAAKYNVSAERIRQLEQMAMKKIKAEMGN